jgi:hypothetical protein
MGQGLGDAHIDHLSHQALTQRASVEIDDAVAFGAAHQLGSAFA